VNIIWSPEAADDLDRLYAFLAPVAPDTAGKVLATLSRAPDRLLIHPRIGARLEGFNPREVRRIIVGKYELRYEILPDVIYVVRIWHSREDRSFGEV
jgi:plasmid stabilization system protein ParE